MQNLQPKFEIISWRYVLLIIIVLFSLVVRFYNFSNRITYGPEQARSLVTSASYVKKPSLLGQEYFRITTQGHKLFYGATWNYSLVPLLLLFNYDVIKITGYFGLLNIVTGLCLYLISLRVFNWRVAIISITLFLFNDYMIYHSLFLWPYNYLPILGLLSFYLVYLFRKKNSLLHIFILGCISGFGFSLQYLYLPYILIVVTLLFIYSKNKWLPLLFFTIGLLISNLPMVLFDLRHSFYNFRTLFGFFIDTLSGNSNATFNYYYLLPLWPIAALIFGYVLEKLFIKRKLMLGVVIIVYIFLNLNSKLVDFSKSLGMSEGLTWKKILLATNVISQDKPNNFNLVSLLDFDTRGYILRYPVEYIGGYKPLGEEEYPEADSLYVISRTDYNFDNPSVWELVSVMPYKYDFLKKIDSTYGLYKISKIK